MFSYNNFRSATSWSAPPRPSFMQCASPRDCISATLWILEKQYPRAILRRRFGNTRRPASALSFYRRDGWLNRRRKKGRDMVFEEHRVSPPSRRRPSSLSLSRRGEERSSGNEDRHSSFSRKWELRGAKQHGRRSATGGEDREEDDEGSVPLSIAPSGDEPSRVTIRRARECVHQPLSLPPRFCTARIRSMHIGITCKFTPIFIGRLDLFLYF